MIAHLEMHGELHNDNIHQYNEDVRDASSLTVPTDRTFRGAWQYNGDAVEINMTKAKEIHKDNLRAERNERLAALDVSYMKALEAGQCCCYSYTETSFT